jgi:hypothetical protein
VSICGFRRKNAARATPSAGKRRIPIMKIMKNCWSRGALAAVLIRPPLFKHVNHG